MSTLASILIGVVIGLIVGFILGAWVISKFNPKDITYIIEKLRAKKGGIIDVSQQNIPKEEEMGKEPKEHKLLNKIKARRAERKANNN